jgi:Holliday junction resolvasome RuvABC endonuclease subunit
MNILAIDIGTTTGWAVRSIGGSISSGVIAFKPGRFEARGMSYLRFQSWLNEMNSTIEGGINCLYFEEVRRHLGVDAAHVYGGFLGQLTSWCEYKQIPYAGVPVGTIKKAITGKGNASKEKVIESINKLGHATNDHNEADALALLYYAINKWKN